MQRSAAIWLISALFAALGYPLVKYLEIRWNLAHGINGNGAVFFTVYYYLTLNYLVRASWGIFRILFVLARLVFGSYSADNHAGLRSPRQLVARIPICWLVLFPLFYVIKPILLLQANHHSISITHWVTSPVARAH